MKIPIQFWNKKVKQNLLISSGVWFIFALFAVFGWSPSWRVIFDSFVAPASQALSPVPGFITAVSLMGEGVILIVLINYIRPSLSLLVPFSLLAVYFGIAKIGASMGIRLDFFYAFLFGMAVYLISIIYNYLSFDKERQEIQKTFSLYLAPEYIDELVNNPEKLALGGEERELTIFFSDIRGFSSISEQLSVKDLVELLNEYLTAMTDIVMETKGVVDKYIGDAVMAFWGAPLRDEEHAKHAVGAGLRMLEVLKELNVGWQKRGWPEMKIGIGINTGEAMVGNMGSKRRFNYTLMGDNVNLASRLEGLTKYYGAKIIVSEKTFESVKGEFCGRLLDRVAVKGKKQPVNIYEVLGRKNEEQKFLEMIALTDSAIKFYFNREWDKAVSEFKKLGGVDKESHLTELFVERCEEFKNANIPTDWNGVWEMKTK